VGTLHGNPYERKKWGTMAHWFLRFSEWFFVLCCNELTSVAKSKVDAHRQANKRAIHYIPNGVDSAVSATEDGLFSCAQFGLEEGNYFMFACGRLDPTKGLHHLISAYKMSTWKEKLFIVGDFTHNRTYTKMIIGEIAAHPEIKLFKGLLSRAVLMDAMRKCRLFVFPSEVEAMSMVLLEAITSRRPVICSDIPENTEIVGKVYPYLFRSGSSADLHRVLKLLVNDPLSEEVAGRLREACAYTYSWAKIAAQYSNLYAILADLK